MNRGQLSFLRYLNDQHLSRIDVGHIDGSIRFLPSLVKLGYVERDGHMLKVTKDGKDTLFEESGR